MNRFDVSIFHALNRHAGHMYVLDGIMSFFAEYAMEIYGALLIIAWFVLPRRDEDRRHALVVAVIGGFMALFVNMVIGFIWYRPRPFAVPGIGAHKIIPHAADTSFPSDHTSGGFGMSSALWGSGPSWLSWIFTICSAIVMIARIYVGMHWPTDAIAGMVIGILCGRLAVRLSTYFRFITSIGLWIFRMGRYAV
ncbi:phosphatase PAP2 family protein [Alicyclobacillus fodiniaquatilis]|uniref:Phosphatase PAP2 family protein n=1 Tax=Alicyclobacillus fodiniaquatilis TaxID=1661150 RepID=A0ABW4JNG3_9BACL